MMNRVNILIGLVNILLVSLLIAWFITGRDKMVYVDSNKLVSGYKGMQEANKVIG